MLTDKKQIKSVISTKLKEFALKTCMDIVFRNSLDS